MFAHYSAPDSGPTQNAYQSIADLATLNTPFFDGKSKMVLNFASAQDGMASTLGALPTNDILLQTARKLATKGILASDGNCVVAKKHRDIVESYIRYAEAHGLINPKAIERVQFVEDPTDISSVLETLALDRKEGLLYLRNAAASDLLSESGMYRIQDLTSAAVIERYANKHRFRNEMEKLFGEDIFPFPRVFVGDHIRESERYFWATHELLKQATEYYPSRMFRAQHEQTDQPLLFLQTVDGAGGKGNRVVFVDPEGTLKFSGFYGETASFVKGPKQLERFLNHLIDSGPSFELTPYLDLLGSYAYTIMVSDSGVTLLGPRRQITDPVTNSFMASSFDIHQKAEDYVDLGTQTKRTLDFGFHLKEQGFRGYTDVDVMDYLTPDNERASAFSESNMRRDSASFILSLIIRREELRSALRMNKLSFRIDDCFSIPTRALLEMERSSEGLKGAEAIAHYFGKSGIPLSSRNDPFGVALLSPPLSFGEEQVLSLGILASSDRNKKLLQQSCQGLFY